MIYIQYMIIEIIATVIHTININRSIIIVQFEKYFWNWIQLWNWNISTSNNHVPWYYRFDGRRLHFYPKQLLFQLTSVETLLTFEKRNEKSTSRCHELLADILTGSGSEESLQHAEVSNVGTTKVQLHGENLKRQSRV